MDLRTVGSALMANRVLPVAYVVGSLALLLAVVILLAGPRPRSAGRRTAGTILGIFGLALVVPSLVLGIAATSSSGPVAPSPTPRPGEELISCASDGTLPPLPAAPPPGCVLVVEWGEEARPTGLLATTGALPLADAQPGHWWYHSPAAAAQHIEAFRARYPGLPIQDLR